MIWSIIPEDFIFAEDNKEEPMLCCSYLGRQVLIKPAGNGQGQIAALLSTNPADFLDARLQTGRIVNINN